MLNKKLIIVHTKETQKYADYLGQLISSIKDTPVVTVVWTEKQYADNKPQISSQQYIVFIGDSKEMQKSCGNLNVMYDNYGMKFAWLGKTARLFTDPRAVTKENSDKFNQFIEASKAALKDKVALTFGAGVAAVVVGLPIIISLFNPMMIVLGPLLLRKITEENKIRESQYQTLIPNFFAEGLADFMGLEVQ